MMVDVAQAEIHSSFVHAFSLVEFASFDVDLKAACRHMVVIREEGFIFRSAFDDVEICLVDLEIP
jgi:hypothetical protein